MTPSYMRRRSRPVITEKKEPLVGGAESRGFEISDLGFQISDASLMRIPRFQFSLRTLLIAVTLLAIPCGYIGWQAKIVRERQSLRMKVTQMGGFHLKLCFSGPPHELSIIRRWLGDQAWGTIMIPESALPQDFDEVRAAFPEAEIEPLASAGPATF